MGGTIACLAALEGQENLSGLILESAAIELHPKTASWTVRTAAKILSKEIGSMDDNQSLVVIAG